MIVGVLLSLCLAAFIVADVAFRIGERVGRYKAIRKMRRTRDEHREVIERWVREYARREWAP